MTQTSTPLRFRDSYALLYALTLAFFVPAIFALGTQPYYSYTPAYLVLMVAPPLVAMLVLVLAHERSATLPRTIGKALLFGVVSMIGGGALFLSTSFLLAFLGPAFESHEFGPLQIGLGVIMAGFEAPLIISAISRVRTLRVGAVAEAVVMVAAVVAIAWIGWVILTQQGTLSDVLRKDQVSYLVGGVVWYIPAYALVGTIVRSLGVL